ncbi:MAG: flagellar basal body rod protein FlgB [Planctomycetota bacterium]
MFEVLFDNTSLPVLQNVMGFAELRQKVLAHDVANVNTPGFRHLDLNVEAFTETLSEAIERRDSRRPHRFEPKSTRDVTFGDRMQATARPIEGLMNYYDGADRGIEHIQNEMLKNAIWHQAATRLFTHQSALLETAIRERVR